MQLLRGLALMCCASPALGNTGWGGMSGTGLEFSQTDAVSLIEEDLLIGLDRVTVDYVFRNETDADVTGELIFPLPPVYSPDGFSFPDGPPAPEDLVDFSLQVNGQILEPKVDVIAVIQPDWTEATPPSAAYDAPGRDVTDDLRRLGIPLTFDSDLIRAALLKLSNQDLSLARELGLVDDLDQRELNSPHGLELYGYYHWSLAVRHHWTQTFPVGQDVRISISYRNVMAGGLFDGALLQGGEGSAGLKGLFCLDDADIAEITRLLESDRQPLWLARVAVYVLRTANTWKGPITDFRLTIDKGEPGNFVAVCLDDDATAGQTTVTWEKRNFVPDRDLTIFFLTPLQFDLEK